MTTWHKPEPEIDLNFGLRGWVRILRRAIPLAIVTFGCLGILLLMRLIERPIFGLHRPFTPYITQFVCISAFWIMGIKRRVEGVPMRLHGAAVANHTSWLDIFALNASKRIYFVSKQEVAGWPGIGWLARATGTVFVERRSSQARAQANLFEARLRAGHRLMFFPEGTTTDGQRVLPFKSTLFAAFFSETLPDMQIQPVTVLYEAPVGERADFYGWWGEMSFGPHLLLTLVQRRQGRVAVRYHAPVSVNAHQDRKTLAKHLEQEVRGGLPVNIG